jgi:hypothetical protein
MSRRAWLKERTSTYKRNDTGLMAIFTETWSGKFRGHDVRQRRIELLNRQYTFIGPCAPEALLDAPNAEARFAADGYMPYWAEFWPASLLLMDAVASWAPPGPGAPPKSSNSGAVWERYALLLDVWLSGEASIMTKSGLRSRWRTPG